HQIVQAKSTRTLQSPLETGEAFGAGGWVAEAARLLDGLRRRVVLARKAQHGARHAETGLPSRFRQTVAFFPRRMVRVAAGNLYDVDAQAIQKPFQLGNTLYLERPAADANCQRFNGHRSSSGKDSGARRRLNGAAERTEFGSVPGSDLMKATYLFDFQL